MTERSDLLAPAEVIERALSYSSSSQCVVIVEEHHNVDCRFANNTMTTNGQRRDRRVSVIAFADRPDGIAVGVASRSGSDEIEELVRAAEVDASGASVAEDQAPLLAADLVDADFGDEAPGTQMSVLSGLVGALSSGFDRARSISNVLSGFATHGVSTTYLGMSTGVRRRYVHSVGTLDLVARTKDGSASTWTSAATTDFSDVDFDVLDQRLEGRLQWAKRKIELPAGRYEVIMPPSTVADMMIPLVDATSGRDAEDGSSVFSSPNGGTRIGDQLSSLPFSLFSDPLAEGLECSPFLSTSSSGTDVSVFDNGYPVERTNWLDEGRLQRLSYHRAGAERSGALFTPPGENLILSLPYATASIEDLVAGTKRGLLLTCLWYIREVDLTTMLLTGLTRDGVYLVEDGEIVGAVNNFRFNESPIDVLSRAIEAGRTERTLAREFGEWMTETAMPSLRVADFNMSSVSEAS